jgi:hypothetical protein
MEEKSIKKYTDHIRIIILENSLLHKYLITNAIKTF